MNLLKNFGPGLITAGAAIGTSHFVQATRAGSYFGFDLLWLIVVIHIVKYPFIEFGSRYTSATGENLLVGYWRFNKPIFYLITFLSIFFTPFSFAANGFICAGIIKAVLNVPLSITTITALLLGFCTILISIGRYKLLDGAMKIFIVILSLTTLVAVILAAKNFVPLPQEEIFYSDYSPFEMHHIPFLIALMGFMPGSIDLSVWHSLWLKARNKTNNVLNFKQARLDFNVGYVITIITAVLFLSVGALMVNNSQMAVPDGADDFARLLIDSYVQLIGSWASPIVGLAILVAMMSTVLAVVDSYPRLLTESFSVIKRMKNGDVSEKEEIDKSRLMHSFLMAFYSIVAVLVIMFLFSGFKQILDFTASVAFVVAPLYAFVNYKIVTSELLPEEFRPGFAIRILSWFGLLFLMGFLGWFLWAKIFVI
jgi:Mn2+/Fe2+ NRAMP family transporter